MVKGAFTNLSKMYLVRDLNWIHINLLHLLLQCYAIYYPFIALVK